MTQALVVSNLLLWILLAALAAIVLALVRQIGILHERVAPAGALLGREGPRPGERAPVLEVEDLAGRRLRLGGAQPSGSSTLLLFVSPSCPVCKALLPAARSLCSAEGSRLRLVLASDGPRAEHEAFLREQRLEGETYVLSAELGLRYQVGRLPHAVLLDADGVVRGRGLVNSREHLESLCEAQAHGVASLQEWLAQRGEAERRSARPAGGGAARVQARPRAALGDPT
jgi:methylamine dehydrogenase accessory protein MauD